MPLVGEPDRDSYALALGNLAMEAARLEQETKNLIWMICGPPYDLGLLLTKGKQMSAICDELGKDLAKLMLPPEVAKKVIGTFSKIKAVWHERNDLLHASWILGSPGGDYYEELVKVTFGKKGVSLKPTPVTKIEEAIRNIKAVTQEVRTVAFDEVLPHVDAFPPVPELQPYQESS